MAKEIKNKVGRPKLADKDLKKESIIVSVVVLVILVVIGILGFNVLTINYNPKYSVGNVYNPYVNSCVVNDNKINCGPNVTYMKYKLDDNEYIEVNKEEKNISVELSKYQNIKICYKTNNTDLRCNK